MARIAKLSEETNAEREARYYRILGAFQDSGVATRQVDIGKALVPPISQAAVSRWKRGVNPSVGHLAQIIKLTGVSGTWLLTGEGPMYIDADGHPVVDDISPLLLEVLGRDQKAALMLALGKKLSEERGKRGKRADLDGVPRVATAKGLFAAEEKRLAALEKKFASLEKKLDEKLE